MTTERVAIVLLLLSGACGANSGKIANGQGPSASAAISLNGECLCPSDRICAPDGSCVEQLEATVTGTITYADGTPASDVPLAFDGGNVDNNTDTRDDGTYLIVLQAGLDFTLLINNQGNSLAVDLPIGLDEEQVTQNVQLTW